MVKELKAVILGDCNVGKTTILKKIMKLPIYNVATTINLDIEKYVNHDISINFWDTSGQERFDSINRNYIKNSNIILLVFDINNYSTYMKLKNYWLPECKKYLDDDDTTYFIIGNKMDLFPNHPIHRYKIENQEIIVLSALNDNLNNLLFKIYKKSLEMTPKISSNIINISKVNIYKNKCCN